MDEAQELENSERYSVLQLLGVLAEAKFNPEGARLTYQTLKETPLYDRESGQWISYIDETQALQDSDRYSNAQLLGILVEAELAALELPQLIEKVPPLPLVIDFERGDR